MEENWWSYNFLVDVNTLAILFTIKDIKNEQMEIVRVSPEQLDQIKKSIDLSEAIPGLYHTGMNHSELVKTVKGLNIYVPAFFEKAKENHPKVNAV